MGRPRKADHLKIVAGDRKDRINTSSPVPATSEVVPPYKLTKEPQAIWDRLAPDLIHKQILTAWDVDAFALYCELVSLNRRALQMVRGKILVDSSREDGAKVYNRAMQAVRETSEKMMTIGSRFGLTPLDRSRISIGGGSHGNLDADYG